MFSLETYKLLVSAFFVFFFSTRAYLSEEAVEVPLTVHLPDALPSTSLGSLHHDREADLLCSSETLVSIQHTALAVHILGNSQGPVPIPVVLVPL